MDTGATTTLVSTSIFNQIPDDEKPKLYRTGRKSPKSANGQPISCKGQGVFTITLGPLKLKKLLLVTDIEDDVLLGADILLQDESGPADLILSEGTLKLQGMNIPLHQVGVVKATRRVSVADHYVIPEQSEAILEAHIDRHGHGDDCLLVEGTEEFLESHTLAVAPCLVDATDQVTVKVRVINPFDKPISVKQDTIIGHAVPVCKDDVQVLVDQEDPEEEDNHVWVRRVKFHQFSNSSDCVRRTSEKSPELKKPPAHLAELFSRTSEDMSLHEKNMYTDMLHEMEKGFQAHEDDLGHSTLVKHTMPMPDNTRPVKQRARPVPLAFKGEDEKAVQKMLKQGVVRPSTSAWASPLVLVFKKDSKTVRPCVDYRKVNALTQKDAFPLPRTQDCLDTLAGAESYSTLDLASAFHQVAMNEADIPKTAFITRCGLYEFTKMPFGLTGATATFQRLMELALNGLQWNTCLIFVDDVIVFGKTFEEHLARLSQVLKRIIAAGLKLKPSKCHFFRKSVVFLGHLVSKDGVLPDPSNVERIQKMEPPHDMTTARSFLGMTSYYRRFIKSYSEIAHPITQLTKNDHDFVWTDECWQSFQRLKDILTGPEVMAYPTDDGQYLLDTDASAIAIGAVLSQIQEGRERVIAYGSKVLSKTERNWCVTDRELYAIRYFTEYYRQYLLGRRFTVRSDHQALKWLFSLKEPKNRIARWIEALSEFDFEVEYRAGKKHGNADGMSRCVNPRACQCEDTVSDQVQLKCGPCNKCSKRTTDMEGDHTLIRRAKSPQTTTNPWTSVTTVIPQTVMAAWLMIVSILTMIVGRPADINKTKLPENDTQPLIRRVANKISPWLSLGRGSHTRQVVTRSSNKVGWALPYSMKDVRRKQMSDADIKPVLEWMEAGKRPTGPPLHTSSPATRHYVNCWDSLHVRDGVLFREFHKKDASGTYLQFLVPSCMKKELLHEMHNSVLSGHLGRKKTQEKLLQRFYWYGVREDVNLWVEKCDECGAIKAPNQTLKAPLGDMKVGAPMDRLATDIMGPLPETPRGNKFILVVTDHFTKWVEIFPVPDQTAATCADKILNEVIARLGCPYDLHSDQGRNYESRIFAELCALLEVRKTRTSPGHPRSNGQSERFNRTLIRMIKAYLKGQQREWDRNLGCLAAAYRATPNETTGMTPNLLMLGREVRLPAEVMFGSQTTLSGEVVSSYGEYVEHLKERMQQAHQLARQHIQCAGKRQKQDYDAKQFFYQYDPGDLVWCLSDLTQLDITPKLRKPYEGPYLVVAKHNDLNYLVQYDQGGKQRVLHHNRLKPYNGDLKLRWAAAALNKHRRDQQ